MLLRDSENRRKIRYKGKFPVELENGAGMTCDFSSSGIFFETDKSFTPGQAIDFTIVLEYVDPDRPVYLKCKGAIVRVEDRGRKVGIAANIRSYTFEKLKTTDSGRAAKKTRKTVKKNH